MEHIGIDLGSRESQVCVRNGVGAIVEEKALPHGPARTVLGEASARARRSGDMQGSPSGSRAGHASRDMMCGWWPRPWSAPWASAIGD